MAKRNNSNDLEIVENQNVSYKIQPSNQTKTSANQNTEINSNPKKVKKLSRFQWAFLFILLGRMFRKIGKNFSKI